MRTLVQIPSIPAAQRPKMLVVDDQSITIRILYEIFQTDFDVFMATEGQQALDMCANLRPDVVLLDVIMPGMDGFEACRQLKATPSLANIPVIFLTAHYNEQKEVDGFLAGGADFLHKPINPVITRARVNNQLLMKQQADVLRSFALIDGMTGIANRRLFEESLAAAFLQAARDRACLSLALMDVDFFKQYNDYYGHQAGDECLRQIATAMDGLLARPYDLVARYGGEEFVALAPATDTIGISHLAQRMVDGVRGLQIEHQQSPNSVVTISVGAVSAVPGGALTPELFVKAADEQLYLAKSTGRAKVCCRVL